MSMTVKIVFSGLIALVTNKEIPTTRQQQPVKTGPFSAYLLKAPETRPHLPQLWILKDKAVPYNPAPGCEPETKGDFLVWNLSDRRIQLDQEPGGSATYSRDSRGKGTTGRHYDAHQSTPDDVYKNDDMLNPKTIQTDLSWVPEMRKILPKAKLMLQDKVAASIEGIQGTFAAAYVADLKWDWCGWSNNACPKRTPGTKYDQAFAGAVEATVELPQPQLFLLPRSNADTCTDRIRLTKPDVVLYVVNHPDMTSEHHTMSIGSHLVGDDTNWCTADDFAIYFMVVENPPDPQPRPFFEAASCKYQKINIPGSAESFCPPVIFGKP